MISQILTLCLGLPLGLLKKKKISETQPESPSFVEHLSAMGMDCWALKMSLPQGLTFLLARVPAEKLVYPKLADLQFPCMAI